MGVLCSFRRVFLVLSIALIGSLAMPSCSVVPDPGAPGGDSGLYSSSSSQDDGADPELPGLPSDLAGVWANHEACLGVTAVVVGGSGLVLVAKVGAAEDSVPEVQKLVREAMTKVPGEVKEDLENLLQVLDPGDLGTEGLDDGNANQAMAPISAWLDKYCKGK